MPPPRAQVHDAAMLITVNARRHRVEEWALRYELPQAEVAKAKTALSDLQRKKVGLLQQMLAAKEAERLEAEQALAAHLEGHRRPLNGRSASGVDPSSPLGMLLPARQAPLRPPIRARDAPRLQSTREPARDAPVLSDSESQPRPQRRPESQP